MKSCRTCRRADACGNCRDYLEKACADSGEFKAWKPRKLFVDADHFVDYITATKYKGGFTAKNVGGRFYAEYKGEFEVD